MPTKIKTQRRPACGGTMRYVRQSDPISHGGHHRSLQALGFWCDDCGEAIFSGAALRRRERAFLELTAEVDGVLGPKEVARICTKLAMSRGAGALLGAVGVCRSSKLMNVRRARR